MKKEMICITCPLSCHLTIEIENNEVISVSGNTCPRGKEYAISECLHPVRMLTSTVVINYAALPRCPISTSRPIPFDKIKDVMNEVNKVIIDAPIAINEVIIKNVCGLDVDIVSSRTMNKV